MTLISNLDRNLEFFADGSVWLDTSTSRKFSQNSSKTYRMRKEFRVRDLNHRIATCNSSNPLSELPRIIHQITPRIASSVTELINLRSCDHCLGSFPAFRQKSTWYHPLSSPPGSSRIQCTTRISRMCDGDKRVFDVQPMCRGQMAECNGYCSIGFVVEMPDIVKMEDNELH